MSGLVGSASAIAIGGPSVVVSITTPGDTAQVTFAGSAGEHVDLGMTSADIGSATAELVAPDGGQVGSDLFVFISGRGSPPGAWTLPAEGTYTILVDPHASQTRSVTLTLSDDLVGTIAQGGSSPVAAISRPEQRERLTFTGSAGEHVGLGMTSSDIDVAFADIVAPDGSAVGGGIVYPGSGGGAHSYSTLPADGTYTVIVGPYYSEAGSVTLTLSDDLVGTIAQGGSSPVAAISRPGQRERLTFTGSAGEHVGLGMTSSSIDIGTTHLLSPDGSQVGGAGYFSPNGSGGHVYWTLPAGGTYTLTVEPDGADTGSVTLTLSDDLVGTIAQGGSSPVAAISRPGQRERLTFTGSAGEHVGLGMTSSSIDNGTTYLLAPDGSQIGEGLFYAGSGSDANATLPSDGSYTLSVEPDGADTGSVTLTLSDDIIDTIAIDGPAVAISIVRAGQNARLSFSGTTSQAINAVVSDSTFNQASLDVRNTDGSTVQTSRSALRIRVKPDLIHRRRYWNLDHRHRPSGQYRLGQLAPSACRGRPHGRCVVGVVCDPAGVSG